MLDCHYIDYETMSLRANSCELEGLNMELAINELYVSFATFSVEWVFLCILSSTSF